jgi:hypothetical protein
MASHSLSRTTRQSRSDSEGTPVIEKAMVAAHENTSGSANHNSENVTQDPLRSGGIDEKREKRILLKLDIRFLPFLALLFLLSFM